MQFQFIQQATKKVCDPYPGIVRVPTKEAKPSITVFRTKEPLVAPTLPITAKVAEEPMDEPEEAAPVSKPRLKGARPVRKLL